MARTKISRKKFKYAPRKAPLKSKLFWLIQATKAVDERSTVEKAGIAKCQKPEYAIKRKLLTLEEKRQRKKLQNAKQYNTPANLEKIRQQRQLKRELERRRELNLSLIHI